MKKATLTDEQLLESIRSVGQLGPIIRFHGTIVDGRRIFTACVKLRRRPWFIDLHHPQDVAKALWVVHPERCYARFGVQRTPMVFAAYLGLRVGQVSWLYPRSRAPEDGKRSERVTVRLPADLRVRLQEIASDEKTLSDLIRAACYGKARRKAPEQ